ncbi:MAG: hypothetical protein R3E08_02145 [Thiotrichaceae bacterium]
MINRVASSGEVMPTLQGFDLQSFAKLGTLSLTNNLMSVSGNGGNGRVFIRGGLFQMSAGWIENNNSGTPAGGTTDVNVENMTFLEGASIDTSTLSTGDGGSANFTVTDTLNLLNGGNLHVNTASSSPQARQGRKADHTSALNKFNQWRKHCQCYVRCRSSW